MKRAAVFGLCACFIACSCSGGTSPPEESRGGTGGGPLFDASALRTDSGESSSSSGAMPPVTDGGPSGEASGADGATTAVDGGAEPFDSGVLEAPDAESEPPADGGADEPIDGSSARPPDGAAAMPWLAYNEAPPTRTLTPVAVSAHGNVTGADAGALSGQPQRLNGAGSGVTFDFGREVGGIVSVTFGTASDAAQKAALAFCESSLYIGPTSDLSTGGVYADGGYYADGALAATVTPSSTYVMPPDKLRGGFRYLSVYLDTPGWVEVTGAKLEFTAAPTMAVPNEYANYFYSNDDLLNQIWYAGAYTVQLNTIDPTQGRAWPAPKTGWDNGATIAGGSTVLVDGAKRDRTVWPGDLGISVSTAYVSTGDLTSTMNALNVLYAGQDPSTGELPARGRRFTTRAATRAPIPTTSGHLLGRTTITCILATRPGWTVTGPSTRRPLRSAPPRSGRMDCLRLRWTATGDASGWAVQTSKRTCFCITSL